MAENQSTSSTKKDLNDLLKELEGIFSRIKTLTGETIAEVVAVVNDHLGKINQPKIELDPKLFEKKKIPIEFDFQDSLSKFDRIIEERKKSRNQKDENGNKIPLTHDEKLKNTSNFVNGITQGFGGDLSSVNKELSTMMETLGALGEDMAVINGIGGALEGLSSIDFKNPVSWVTGTMKALSSIFGIADAKKEAKIVRLQGQIKELANDYKQLQHEIENCYSDEVNGKYDEELENLQKQKAKAEEMARLEASKKKSDKSKVEQYHEQAAQLQRDIEKTQKAQIEMLAGTSIQSAIDTFADALVEAYAKGESGAEALGEKTKDVLKNAVKEALKRQFLGKGIEDAVNYLGEAMKDGFLSPEEKARFEAFVQAAGASFTQAMDVYSDLFKGSTEIESMRGEISKALTETTASKLEGIFRGTYDGVLGLRTAARELVLMQRMGTGNLAELLRQNFLIVMNTRRSADNSDNIRQDLRAIHTDIARIAHNTKFQKYAL